jgi:hypothetical protein
MKNQNFTAGLLLSILGVVLLLRNFDLLNINWNVVLKFWPLLLIYLGLATLYGNKKTWVVPIAMLFITLVSILLYWLFKESAGLIV